MSPKETKKADVSIGFFNTKNKKLHQASSTDSANNVSLLLFTSTKPPEIA